MAAENCAHSSLGSLAAGEGLEPVDAGCPSRIEVDDPYLAELSSRWGSALEQTFATVPRYRF